MSAATRKPDAKIDRIRVSAYRVPTDAPESDGTYEWDQTVLVVALVDGGPVTGLGYTYADPATAQLVAGHLAKQVRGLDAFDVPAAYCRMMHSVRNLGRPGIAAMAISALDCALWDLKARLLNLPLVSLLGAARQTAPIYGSGGFTSYSIKQLQEQLGSWAAEGIRSVKMKIGRDAKADLGRVQAAREAIGPDVGLFVDANGGYSRKQALAMAERFVKCDVRWFEEPVSSDDLAGLKLMRDRGPAGMEIAAGEYGYTPLYFRRMLEAQAVDVLQADATRCGGITGFLHAAALADAFGLEISGHCAPALHLPVACAAKNLRHLEYFHDHVRIERLVFDGVVQPTGGDLQPDLSRPGNGLLLKESDAEQYQVQI